VATPAAGPGAGSSSVGAAGVGALPVATTSASGAAVGATPAVPAMRARPTPAARTGTTVAASGSSVAVQQWGSETEN